MQFTRVDGSFIEGTRLMGYLSANYEEVVAVFGEPERWDGEKSRVEWDVQFEDGTVACIYDWRQNAIRVEDIAEWNIGGRTQHAMKLVGNAMDLPVYGAGMSRPH
jgi:hypothetical protein